MALFVEVVRAGSFRGAARSLGMPPSTVSRRIAGLERALGLRLLDRTTRALSLTEPGRVYFGRAERIVAEAALAHEELEAALTEASGLIRVSAPADFAPRVLAPIAARFVALHPKVRFRFDLSPVVVNLAADPFDLAIRMGPLPDSTMIARRIGTMPSGLFAAAPLAASLPPIRSVRDLADVPFIAVQDRPLVPGGGASYGRPVVETNSVGMTMELVRLGVGVGELPIAFVEEAVVAGDLIPILPDLPFTPTPVHALTTTRLLPARTRLFLEFLAKEMARQEPEGTPARRDRRQSSARNTTAQ